MNESTPLVGGQNSSTVSLRVVRGDLKVWRHEGHQAIKTCPITKIIDLSPRPVNSCYQENHRKMNSFVCECVLK